MMEKIKYLRWYINYDTIKKELHPPVLQYRSDEYSDWKPIPIVNAFDGIVMEKPHEVK